MEGLVGRASRQPKPPTIPAVDAGLKLLGRRAHSRFELRRKLARRGYDSAEVDAALARLIELGYLDDRSFAAAHVRRRSAGLGPLALSVELAARGVDRTAAGEALATFDPEAQLAAAEHLACRLRGGKTFAGYKMLLDRLGPKLVRRGFSPAIARAACERAWSATGSITEP